MKMANETIDKYIVSINDIKLRLILQTMMKFSYWLKDNLKELTDKVENPLDVQAMLQWIDSKIAEKMWAINQFVNEKLKPYIARIDSVELLLRQRDNSVLFDKVEALEKFIEKLDRIEPQDNSELINRIEELEKKYSECSKKCDKETTSKKPKKEKKETKPKKKSVWEKFKKSKK